MANPMVFNRPNNMTTVIERIIAAKISCVIVGVVIAIIAALAE
jgi:flagellar biosynthesis protein FliQ